MTNCAELQELISIGDEIIDFKNDEIEQLASLIEDKDKEIKAKNALIEHLLKVNASNVRIDLGKINEIIYDCVCLNRVKSPRERIVEFVDDDSEFE